MPDNQHQYGHRERLRARLTKSPSDLADYEILELLLAQVLTRKDTKPLAKELLERFQSVKGVLDAKPAELSGVEGFGPKLTAYWLLLRELLARYAESPLRRREVLASPARVAAMARQRLAGNPLEEVWLAYVDGQNHLLAWERYHKGSSDNSTIYPRDIVERAILLKASGFILVHNHPGGASRPSGADLQATRQLREAAQALSLRFMDHIIVTDDAFCSLSDEGLL
ncbi:MAG: DNA repair protein RadC [Deltaproteobacteria bacterium]|jgi:DNA repair protein RadC|nr:DNA repair protein RadC [Deltaproteobacteria bacterium]